MRYEVSRHPLPTIAGDSPGKRGDGGSLDSESTRGTYRATGRLRTSFGRDAIYQEKSMLFVKIMSDQDLPDTDPYKHYTIAPVANNEVMRFAENPIASSSGKESRYVLEVHAPAGGIETHELTGNAYVMTESGKTIASHGA